MPSRSRVRYALLAALTIILGLASRRFAAALPAFIADWHRGPQQLLLLGIGDTLWATLVFLLLALVFPRARTLRLAAAALALAFAVECSQLYHAPWLDALRATRLGLLVLGNGFLGSDLVCYTVGVALACALDRRLTPAATRSRTSPRR